MKSFVTLLKTCLIANFNPGRVFSRRIGAGRLKNAIGWLLAGALGVFMVFYITFYVFMLAHVLHPYGLDRLVITGSMVLGSLLILFTSIFMIQGTLFQGKDNDMLLALPVRPWQIITAKLSGVILSACFFSLVFTMSAGAAYLYYNPNVSKALLVPFAIGSILLGFVPVTLSAIFAFILSLFTARMRHKNLFSVVISIAALCGIMYLSFNIAGLIKHLIEKGDSILQATEHLYPPAGLLTQAALDHEPAKLLLLLPVCVLPLAAIIAILSPFFAHIHSKLSEGAAPIRGGAVKFKESSPISALLAKEFGRFFGTPIYIINTSVGSILLPLMAIAVAVGGSNMLSSLLKMPVAAQYLVPMLTVVAAAMAALTCTTSPSVSLEGRFLWILRAHPVRTADVFKAKIMLNLLVFLPSLLLAGAILIPTMSMSAVDALYFILLPALCSFATAALGLFINLLFPKLDWVSEVSVVKQSLSVLLSIAGGFALVLVPVLVYCYFLITVMSIHLFMAAAALFLLLVSVLLIYLLKTVGRRIFERL